MSWWRIDQLTRPPLLRRQREQAAAELVDVVARSDETLPELRSRWLERCKLILAEWSGQRKYGWPELIIQVLVATELIAGELPESLKAIVEDPTWAELRDAWLASRRRLERYVPMVKGGVLLARITGSGASSRLVSRTGELVDHAGNSHQLMFALYQRNLLADLEHPCCVTGALEGDEIRPVESLTEKVLAWFREFRDEGIFISPPTIDPEIWKKVGELDWDRWLTAASIPELIEKLRLRRQPPPIKHWDGAELVGDSTVRLRRTNLEWSPKALSLISPLIDAVYETCALKRRRRILVFGEPGSGKSVWSRQTVALFTGGPLGALGYAHHVRARGLSKLPPSDDRCWLIIDGLDELDPGELARLLQQVGDRNVIATSRPFEEIKDRFGPSETLWIEDLDRYSAGTLLESLGRKDLGTQLRDEASFSLLPLRPLYLALLARITKPLESIRMNAEQLYTRLYQNMLDAAVVTERLDRDLRSTFLHLLDIPLGRLAYGILTAPSGTISEAALRTALEETGLTGTQLAQTIEGLQNSHLVVRAYGGWDFSHRSLAEWMAAKMLRSEVGRGGSELELLRKLGGGRDLWCGRVFQLLISFYVPHAKRPDQILDAILTKEILLGISCEEKQDIIQVAVDVAGAADWARADTNHLLRAWRVFVRLRLAEMPAELDRHRPRLEMPERFRKAVGPHLPTSWPELIELSGVKVEERSALLPWFSSAQVDLVRELLEGSWAEQRAALAWLQESDEPVPRDWVVLRCGQLAARTSSDDRNMYALERALFEVLDKPQNDRERALFRRRACEWPDFFESRIERWAESGDDLWETTMFGLLDRLSEVVEQVRHALQGVTEAEREAIFECASRETHDDDGAGSSRAVRFFATILRVKYSARSSCPRAPQVAELVQRARGFAHLISFLSKLFGKMEQVRLELIWQRLPPTSVHRTVALELLRELRPCPAFLSVAQLLEHTEDLDIPYAMLQPGYWRSHHLDELHHLVDTGTPAVRIAAVLVIARLENRDQQIAVAELLDPANETLVELGLRYLRRNRWYSGKAEDDCKLRLPAERLPLEFLAWIDHPIWRTMLSREMEDTRDVDRLGELLNLAAQHEAKEVASKFRALYDSGALGLRSAANILALDPTDREIRAQILRNEDYLPYSIWNIPPNEAELEILFTREKLTPELLKKPASTLHRRIVEELRARRDRLRALEKPAPGATWQVEDEYRRKSADLKTWIAALQEAAFASLDDNKLDLSALISFALRIFGGDVHSVSAMPGPLGSEFDEPEDQDFESHHENRGLIDAFVARLRAKIACDGDTSSLERLFEHPSETLQLEAFRLRIEHVPPHGRGALAARALEAHSRVTETRWTGEIQRLNIALAVGPKSGTIAVEPPQINRQFWNEARKHLTPAHRPEIESWLQHPNSALRAAAADWLGEHGNAGSVRALEPLLLESQLRVFRGALYAWTKLSPATLLEAIARADRRSWSTDHYGFIFAAFKEAPPKKSQALTWRQLINEVLERLSAEPREEHEFALRPNILRRDSNMVDVAFRILASLDQRLDCEWLASFRENWAGWQARRMLARHLAVWSEENATDKDSQLRLECAIACGRCELDQSLAEAASTRNGEQRNAIIRALERASISFPAIVGALIESVPEDHEGGFVDYSELQLLTPLVDKLTVEDLRCLIEYCRRSGRAAYELPDLLKERGADVRRALGDVEAGTFEAELLAQVDPSPDLDRWLSAQVFA